MEKRIPWGRVMVEGAVIVVSILLALTADAWWAQRQDRVEEAAILADLHDEFRGHHDELTRLLEVTERKRDAIADLQAWLQGEQFEAAQLDSLWNLVVIMTGFDAASGAYDAVVSAGRLDLIRSREIRAGLAAWPHEVEEVTTREAGVHDIVVGTLIPLLAEAGAPLNRILAASWEWPSSLPEDRVVEARYESLRQNVEVESILALRYAWTTGLRNDYRNALAASDEMIALLESRPGDLPASSAAGSELLLQAAIGLLEAKSTRRMSDNA